MIALIGLIVTGSSSFAAWRIDRGNEHRLLLDQTRQAASLISASIQSITDPLQSVLDLSSATGGDPAQFARFMSRSTGASGPFSAASLWRSAGSTATPLTSIGGPPALALTSPQAAAVIIKASRSPTFVITRISTGSQSRIGYALADPTRSPYVIYAERVIPANRLVPVETKSAFAELDFASYLGPTTETQAVQTTDVALSRLPLTGDTARESIPFGDTTLTFVATARGHLGGDLGAKLPWIFLGGGVVLSIVSALIGAVLVGQRAAAETDAQTIAGLYDKLDRLYGEQRSISQTLQHALLPASNPVVAGIEVACRYVAGVRGVDIGGDWYSMIVVDDTHFAFVVGDVSGRGVAAAAAMARMRFTLRAYLAEGHPPDVALALSSRQLDISRDGHLATAIVGVANLMTREVVLASAGHFTPLIVSDGQASFATAEIGLPLGVAETTYTSSRLVMPPGSMLLAFTDGLVERRTEDVDVGLERLSGAAVSTRRPLEDLITSILSTMTAEGSEDDIAILAFEWDEQAPDPPAERDEVASLGD